MKIIQGNLIELMLKAEYEVALQGCNCLSVQGAGLAAQMVKAFSTNSQFYFPMESIVDTKKWFRHPVNKLGCIDYAKFYVGGGGPVFVSNITRGRREEPIVTIVNCYTQIAPGKPGKYGIPLDYDALRLCMRKVNAIFEGKKVAIPYLIGGGLARGSHEKILEILEQELIGCTPTLIKLP